MSVPTLEKLQSNSVKLRFDYSSDGFGLTQALVATSLRTFTEAYD